jgi:succinyl-CoA synthetase alpha subunit
MGHAGAIVMGNKGTYESKVKALKKAGVRMIDTPSDAGKAMLDALKG